MNSPDRGDVWLVDLGYVAKVRPCLVISIPALDQDRALATLIPHTTSSRGSRFEVQVKAKFLREGVFDVQNIITIIKGTLPRTLVETRNGTSCRYALHAGYANANASLYYLWERSNDSSKRDRHNKEPLRHQPDPTSMI